MVMLDEGIRKMLVKGYIQLESRTKFKTATVQHDDNTDDILYP